MSIREGCPGLPIMAPPRTPVNNTNHRANTTLRCTIAPAGVASLLGRQDHLVELRPLV